MNVKPWYLSKAVIGGLIAMVAGFLGLNVGQDLQAEITNNIDNVLGVAGGAIAIYGRIKATKGIGL